MAYSDPAFNLPFGVYVANGKPVDAKYGPYVGISNAENECFHVDSPIYEEGARHLGLTIGVMVGSEIIEYWFRDGVVNGNLIIKKYDVRTIQNSGIHNFVWVDDGTGNGLFETIAFPETINPVALITAISASSGSSVGFAIKDITTNSLKIQCPIDSTIYFTINEKTI